MSKGGNMLINVDPNAKGEIPVDSVRILEDDGELKLFRPWNGGIIQTMLVWIWILRGFMMRETPR